MKLRSTYFLPGEGDLNSRSLTPHILKTARCPSCMKCWTLSNTPYSGLVGLRMCDCSVPCSPTVARLLGCWQGLGFPRKCDGACVHTRLCIHHTHCSSSGNLVSGVTQTISHPTHKDENMDWFLKRHHLYVGNNTVNSCLCIIQHILSQWCSSPTKKYYGHHIVLSAFLWLLTEERHCSMIIRRMLILIYIQHAHIAQTFFYHHYASKLQIIKKVNSAPL